MYTTYLQCILNHCCMAIKYFIYKNPTVAAFSTIQYSSFYHFIRIHIHMLVDMQAYAYYGLYTLLCSCASETSEQQQITLS